MDEARSRPVAVWLFSVALMVMAMVAVGGATRLTGSGLSITQWKPVSGALPPLSAKAWNEDFALYRATPQYRLVNRGMSLDAFKSIFWWEWGHRLLGRLVGVVFALPLVAFVAWRKMPRRLLGRSVFLFALGGLQGAVGWWMVRSGLEARVSVAPERLAVHLGLALLLLAALVWTGLEAWNGPAKARRGGWPAATAILAGAVFLQCLLGALVAGNHGGLVENDWPMMGGAFVPVDFWRGSAWATFVHGAAATQFDHRMIAYLVLVLAMGVTLTAPAARRRLALVAMALVTGQAALGVATLMGGAPLPLAIAHQADAALVLACVVTLAWRARRA